MAAKEISVKKYVVRLSGEERERLEALLCKGKSPAQLLLKARIMLKADVSEAGEGWSDSRIIEALDTSVSMVYRVRKQLVEEGLEVALSRKQRATPAVARIFDGEKEAKLIALACSKPPKGRVRWTLRLLENKVVELGIVDRASDSTPFRPSKPGGWSSASNGTTRQSTAVGSIWRSQNSASCRPSASIAASPTSEPLSTKSPPGSRTEMQITPRPIGSSQHQPPASNSSTYTLQSE